MNIHAFIVFYDAYDDEDQRQYFQCHDRLLIRLRLLTAIILFAFELSILKLITFITKANY